MSTLRYTMVLLAGFTLWPPFLSLRAEEGNQPLRVVVTLPDLADITKAVGGDKVTVNALVKGTEDPHNAEAKPSYIKLLSQADLFIQVGMELEVGYVPPLIQNASNAAIANGGRGFLDISVSITPLEVPTSQVDRSMGDVHPFGNPHYLLDPVNGLKAARLIREKLVALRPASRDSFEAGYDAFRKKLGAALVGEKLAEKYDVEKLAILAEHGKLQEFLKSQGDEPLLGGWFGTLAPFYGTKAVGDHNLWPYFAQRFGLVMVGYLEPKPGIAPSTKSLAEMVGRMKSEGVKVVLASPYFDPRHAQFVAEKSGARVVTMGHQVGAHEGCETYLALIDHNVHELAAALGAGPDK